MFTQIIYKYANIHIHIYRYQPNISEIQWNNLSSSHQTLDTKQDTNQSWLGNAWKIQLQILELHKIWDFYHVTKLRQKFGQNWVYKWGKYISHRLHHHVHISRGMGLMDIQTILRSLPKWSIHQKFSKCYQKLLSSRHLQTEVDDRLLDK